ncbi:MAG: hypothetical protein F6K65_36690 [Moorea sp. SIO3C2]|nr:hypothetical protein [Moorena sp. SIO3C2]
MRYKKNFPVACCLLPVACCLLPVAYSLTSQMYLTEFINAISSLSCLCSHPPIFHQKSKRGPSRPPEIFL